MNLQVFFTAFLTIFVAELGDKTQLATLAMGSHPGSKWQVFLGASLALVFTTGISILAAELIAQVIAPHLINRAAGILFVILGLLYLKDSFV